MSCRYFEMILERAIQKLELPAAAEGQPPGQADEVMVQAKRAFQRRNSVRCNVASSGEEEKPARPGSMSSSMSQKVGRGPSDPRNATRPLCRSCTHCIAQDHLKVH